MTASLSLAAMAALTVLTAGGYAVATIGMKIAAGPPAIWANAVIALGLLVAVAAEVTLLRNAELPVVYLGIVVLETLLILGYAGLASGSLSGAQVLGAVLVLTGFGLVTMRG